MSYKQTTETLSLPNIKATGYYPNPGYSLFDSLAYSFNRTRSSSGSSVPDWKEKIKRHESATSDFDAYDFAFTKHSGVTVGSRYKSFSSGVIWHEKNEGFQSKGSLPSAPAFTGGSYNTAHNLAVQRLYDVIRSIESPSQTGEDFGEYHQTINQIKRPMAGLLDLTSYCVNNHTSLLKKAKWNNTKRLAKSLADLTLEYRFGVKPLVSTLAEATVALQNRTVMPIFIHFNVSGKGESVTDSNSGWSGSGVIQHMYRTVTRTRFTVRYKGEYRVDHNVDTRSYHASLGLTWRELTPTIWNLCPYSFLVDYVTNLNTFLQVLSVPWSSIAWCNKTVRGSTQEFFQELAARASTPTLYRIESNDKSYYDYHATRILRSSQSSLPLPILQFRPPSEKHLENVLALVSSRLPVIGKLTNKLNRDSGGSLDRNFKLAVRDRNLKIPYPFHR